MRSKIAARSARPDDVDHVARRRAPPAPTTTIPRRGSSRSSRRPRALSGSGPLTAKIETTLGTFTCELYDKQAPITVANFVGLARGAAPLEGPEDRQVGREEALLRRPDLPPRDPRLHDPGRRSAGRRHRQPRLPLRGRVLARAEVRQAGPAGDGQRRPGHERLAVLHHRGDAPAPDRPPHHLRPVRARSRWSPRSPASSAARATSRRPTSS